MTITELIHKLLEICVEYGDIDVYINTNDNAYNVVQTTEKHCRAGSANIFWEADELEDDSETICYLGE